MSQGKEAASRKEKEMVSFLESPEGAQPCQHLDFSQIRPILDFWSPALYKNNCALF